MRYLVGIDGGQSSTEAVIVDERGRILAHGTAGPADHVDELPGSTKCAEACNLAVARALEHAGLPATTSFEAVHIGLSGYDADFDGVVVAEVEALWVLWLLNTPVRLFSNGLRPPSGTMRYWR